MKETQMGLFDSPVIDAALCRPSDTETSHEGAEHAKSIRAKCKTRMYSAYLHGPKTANEAALFCVQCYGEHCQETYRKRSHELERDGLIKSICKAKCNYSGHPAWVMEVV